jgi:MTH538 TIR-like domain (DUF1863).
MPGIFISYRRSDSATVGRIADDLAERFGRQAVFRDIDSISFGKDFRRQLEDTLDRCDVMLAIIGSHWLQDAAGKRLLEPRTDWVRVELERAIARKIPLIPVLVDDAPMATAEVLPESLQDIAYYPQMKLDTGIDYHNHMQRLIGAIITCLSQVAASPTQADVRDPGRSAMRSPDATQHSKFGRAEAALSISAVGFAMLLWALLDRGFGALDPVRLELPWLAFLITAPSIFVCNYILHGPDTWREAWSRRPIVSTLQIVLARTIEASCWLFGVWMAFLLFFSPYTGFVGPDYFVVMIAISLLTAATAIYLFRYKWRWAKALRSSPKT